MATSTHGLAIYEEGMKVPDRIRLAKLLLLLFVLLLTEPSITQYVNFDVTHRWGWFYYHTSQDDFAALDWINRNVSPTELILNDGSRISRYQSSLSLKKLVYSRLSYQLHPQRAADLSEIWLDPANTTNVANQLARYNVSYLLSTSEWGCSFLANTDSSSYGKKPYSPEVYAEIFDSYPFLTDVFRSGPTRVYKVGDVDFSLEYPVICESRRMAKVVCRGVDDVYEQHVQQGLVRFVKIDTFKHLRDGASSVNIVSNLLSRTGQNACWQ